MPIKKYPIILKKSNNRLPNISMNYVDQFNYDFEYTHNGVPFTITYDEFFEQWTWDFRHATHAGNIKGSGASKTSKIEAEFEAVKMITRKLKNLPNYYEHNFVNFTLTYKKETASWFFFFDEKIDGKQISGRGRYKSRSEAERKARQTIDYEVNLIQKNQPN